MNPGWDPLLSIARSHGVHVPADRDTSPSYPSPPAVTAAITPIGDESSLPRDQRRRQQDDAGGIHARVRGRVEREHQEGGSADGVRKVRQAEQGVGGV